MSEQELLKKVMLRASELGCRLFRNNVGLGWTGKTIHVSASITMTLMPGDVVIHKARPLHAGLCEGSSDLIGWGPDGKFIAYEIKSDKGKLTEPQKNFLNAVNAADGIGKCIRALTDIDEKPNVI